MSKSKLVFLLCISLLLSGCDFGDPKVQGGAQLSEARMLMNNKVNELLKANDEADIIIYNDSIFEQTEKIDVKTKDDFFEISSLYKKDGNIEEGMATKLPLGTVIKSVENGDETPLLFADLPGNPKVYKLIFNPYSRE